MITLSKVQLISLHHKMVEETGGFGASEGVRGQLPLP
jgi:hypothetical protein